MSLSYRAGLQATINRVRRRSCKFQPEPCSLLNPGSLFIGKQRMSVQSRLNEEWTVHLTVQHVDWSSRRIYGVMKALDVPNASTRTITTLFEGQILEDLVEGQWRASSKTDFIYWTRLAPFKYMKGEELRLAMEQYDKEYIFLRVKEVAFGDEASKDAGLTIAGFYFVSVHVSTGRWDSLYHDPASAPLQSLQLQRVSKGIKPAFAFR